MTDDHTRRADVLAALDTEPDEPGIQTIFEDDEPWPWLALVLAVAIGAFIGFCLAVITGYLFGFP